MLLSFLAMQVAAQRYQGGAMPVLYKHMVAMAFQIAQFRWATFGGNRLLLARCRMHFWQEASL